MNWSSSLATSLVSLSAILVSCAPHAESPATAGGHAGVRPRVRTGPSTAAPFTSRRLTWEELASYPTLLNAEDGHGHIVLVVDGGASCVAKIRKPTDPADAPSLDPVDCSPAMNDRAWDSCLAGALYANQDGTECACSQADGAPPMMPGETSPCPAFARAVPAR